MFLAILEGIIFVGLLSIAVIEHVLRKRSDAKVKSLEARIVTLVNEVNVIGNHLHVLAVSTNRAASSAFPANRWEAGHNEKGK